MNMNVSEPDTKTGLSRFVGEYDPALFWSVLTLFGVVIGCGLIVPEQTASTLISIRNYLIFNFSWAFLLGVGATLIFSIYLLFSSFGDMKLGKAEDKPEFSFVSWVAMLFSCGMGIGFVFFSVAEPLTHLYQSSHTLDAGTAGAVAGVPTAIQLSVTDWGLHAWALFAIGGWAIAFPAYRLGKPLNIATGLYGILGDRCHTSLWGKVADALGVLGTVGGNATMIGIGVASISYGLNQLFGLELDDIGKAGVMLIVIVAYVCSAATGIERGIKILSMANLILASGVVTTLLFFGNAPLQYLLNLFTQQFGEYFGGLVKMTFWSDAGNVEQRDWLGWWVVFNWLWWISYIPFCGGFIARISKGRTLREYMLGVLLTPLLLTIFWFSIWGGSASYTELNSIAPLWDEVQKNPEAGVYSLLETMSIGWWLSVVVLINIVIFAVTTSDSASYFVAMQMAKGNQNPKLGMRLLWGLIIGVTGIIFQLTGGFTAIKSLAIVVGTPFFFVSIAFIFSVYNMLKLAKKGEM